MKLRRKARVAVLQALYEADVTRHPAGEVLERRFQDHPLTRPARIFARRLLWGVISYCQQLNGLIVLHAPEWPLNQMAVIDRNILRIALYELSDNDLDTPVKVVINEAVELARLFGSDSSPRFVNGVLGAVMAEDLRPALGDAPPLDDQVELTPHAAPVARAEPVALS